MDDYIDDDNNNNGVIVIMIMPWSHDEEQRWLWDNIDESYHDQMIIMIMLKTMLKRWL